LYLNEKLFVIDVGQSVQPEHPLYVVFCFLTCSLATKNVKRMRIDVQSSNVVKLSFNGAHDFSQLVVLYIPHLSAHRPINESRKPSTQSTRQNFSTLTIGARNYKHHTAIGGRSALDLRAKVGVWCMVM
jgi:hypothetical protein